MKNPLKFSKGLKKYNAGIGLTEIFIAVLIACVLTIAILTVFEKVCIEKLKQTLHTEQYEDNVKR